jgi:hypothetical protein
MTAFWKCVDEMYNSKRSEIQNIATVGQGQYPKIHMERNIDPLQYRNLPLLLLCPWLSRQELVPAQCFESESARAARSFCRL